MKTLIETKKLLKLLQNAQGYIVPKKSTLPIISNVLLKVEEKKIIVLSTDLENHLVQTMDAECSDYVKNVGFAVDAKLLSGLLSKIALEAIMIEYQATSIKISSGDNTYQLPFLKGEEFPSFAQINKEKSTSFEIGSAVFKNYLMKALPFVGTDESRPVITSIHLVIKDKVVKLEATDAIKILQTSDTIETDIVADINIPASFAVIFNKIYEAETVIITADDKRIDASGENFELSCRLIEGRYPNTQPIFELARPLKVSFKKDDMLPAIERLMLFSNHLSTSLAITVNHENVFIEAADNDFKLSGAEKIQANYSEHDPLKVGLSGKHLEICLRAFRADDLNLFIKNTTTAVLFEDSNKAVHVLLLPIMI